jgi:hypothetical protein
VSGYWNFDYWLPSSLWVVKMKNVETAQNQQLYQTPSVVGASTLHDRKPHESLWRDERIWSELSDSQKETLEILDHRLLGMPIHALKAVSFHYANRCDKYNQLFALAKSEFRDPRSTLRIGQQLSQCAEDTFDFTLKNCKYTFTEYARCLERSAMRKNLICRIEQFAFDKCMAENGQDKNKMTVYEATIDDAEVPWGAKPLNPHNMRVAHVRKGAALDPLADFTKAPENDAFRAFLAKKEAM